MLFNNWQNYLFNGSLMGRRPGQQAQAPAPQAPVTQTGPQGAVAGSQAALGGKPTDTASQMSKGMSGADMATLAGGAAGLIGGIAGLAGGGAPTADLKRMAAGQGPNPAGDALRKNAQEVANQTMAMAASDRSGNPSLALRNAMQAGAQVQGQAGEQAGQIMLQQQQAAQKQLAATQAANSQRADRLLGGIMNGAGAALPLLLSDARQKQNFQPGQAQTQQMLDQINPVQFQYVNTGLDRRPQVGITAQQLAATPAGAQAVVPTQQGMAIDPTSSMGPIFAALGHLNERLNQIDPRSVPAYQAAIQGPVNVDQYTQPLNKVDTAQPASMASMKGAGKEVADMRFVAPGMRFVETPRPTDPQDFTGMRFYEVRRPVEQAVRRNTRKRGR